MAISNATFGDSRTFPVRRSLYRLPVFWCWSVALADQVEQVEFHRRDFASPLPVYRRCIRISDAECLVQEWP